MVGESCNSMVEESALVVVESYSSMAEEESA